MKKFLALLLSILIIFSMSACNSSTREENTAETTTEISKEQKLAEAAVKKRLDKAKEIEPVKFVNHLLGEKDNNKKPSAEKEKYASEAFNAAIKKFKYEIVSSKKKSDTSVEVTIKATSINGTTAADSFVENYFSYLAESDEEIANSDDGIIVKYMAEAFKTKETTVNEVVIEVQLINGEWTTAATDTSITELLCSNFLNRYNELIDMLLNKLQ